MRAAAKRCVTSHDVARLRQLLLSEPINGAIPHELRGSIWLLLLGLRAEDLLAEDLTLFAKSARNAVSEANSKEQIQKDVDRTRPGLQRFKQRTVRGALLRLLSLFCSRRQVAYVQGFNELLAPFILLADTGGNPRIVYSLFNDFVSRFAPWMLDTSESRVFDVLKRAFKYFERLLLYHDPELFWLLENNMMSPDLYATSWFVTLFARNFTVECVMALWDLLLLSDNPLGITFFGIAMLTDRREELLSVDASTLPETLMMLTAASGDEVRKLWKIGSEMQNMNTPPSFLRLMTERLLTQPSQAHNTALTAARSMQQSVCLQTTPDDLVSGDATFAAWDCRTEAEFHAGHLAQANWLPLDELRACSERQIELSDLARDELQRAVAYCREQRDSSHICLVGSGHKDEDDADINILAKHLTKLSVPYVSTLRGGFKAALAVAQSGSALTSVELVGFDEERHNRARNVRLNASALARQEPYVPPRRQEAPPPNMNDLGAPSPSSATSSPAPVVAMSAESTPKIRRDPTDSPTRTRNSPSHRPELPQTAVPKFSVKDLNSPPRRRAVYSVPRAPTFPAFVSPSESDVFGGDAESPEQDMSKWSALTDNAPSSEDNSSTTTSSAPNFGKLDAGTPTESNSPESLISPNPGERVENETSPSRDGGGGGGSKGKKGSKKKEESPWGTTARAKWLSEESLKYPLESMPKGFTVDVMDDSVMAGLRLFPCRAKAERGSKLRGKNGDFRRRYVGVSKNYFLLLSPHANRNHLLEVKIIRYLQDIVRIAFKRQRPELVTFELRADKKGEAPNEQIVCVMPDGLKECVKLVKEYLLASPENDLDLEGTPRSTASDETPKSSVPEAGTGNDETPKSIITQRGASGGMNSKAKKGKTNLDRKKPLQLDLAKVAESEEAGPFLTTPTVSSSKFFDGSAGDDEVTRASETETAGVTSSTTTTTASEPSDS